MGMSNGLQYIIESQKKKKNPVELVKFSGILVKAPEQSCHREAGYKRGQGTLEAAEYQAKGSV